MNSLSAHIVQSASLVATDVCTVSNVSNISIVAKDAELTQKTYLNAVNTF